MVKKWIWCVHRCKAEVDVVRAQLQGRGGYGACTGARQRWIWCVHRCKAEVDMVRAHSCKAEVDVVRAQVQGRGGCGVCTGARQRWIWCMHRCKAEVDMVRAHSCKGKECLLCVFTFLYSCVSNTFAFNFSNAVGLRPQVLRLTQPHSTLCVQPVNLGSLCALRLHRLVFVNLQCLLSLFLPSTFKCRVILYTHTNTHTHVQGLRTIFPSHSPNLSVVSTYTPRTSLRTSFSPRTLVWTSMKPGAARTTSQQRRSLSRVLSSCWAFWLMPRESGRPAKPT